MTEKQKIFCDEYLVDLNGTRAYKAAYPNVKKDNSAAGRANKLLKDDKLNSTLINIFRRWEMNVLLR